MVSVTGMLNRKRVSATRHDDGRIEGDTDLLMLAAKLAERGTRVAFWPLGSAPASIGDDRSFAITCASSLEEPTLKGLDDFMGGERADAEPEEASDLIH